MEHPENVPSGGLLETNPEPKASPPHNNSVPKRAAEIQLHSMYLVSADAIITQPQTGVQIHGHLVKTKHTHKKKTPRCPCFALQFERKAFLNL